MSDISQNQFGGTPRPGPWRHMNSSRVARARYDSGLQEVQVYFADGTPWRYRGVPYNVWRNFTRSSSPGRYINRVLNGFEYERGPSGGFDPAAVTGEEDQ